MSHSMDGYDDPHGVGRWDKGSVVPTDAFSTDDPWAEEVRKTAHERDREFHVVTSSDLGRHIEEVPKTVPRNAQKAASAPAHGDGWGVVQVRIAGAGKRTYAYAADEAFLIGTWVELPGNVVSDDGSTGVVVRYGRDGYNGPLKTVVRSIPEPSEWAKKMMIVKTMDKAAEIYDAAVAAGVSGDELAAVVLLGQRRLKQLGVRP